MLPTHYSSPSEASPFSSLPKRPSCVLNKLFIRWIAFACVVTSFIWLGRPLVADFLTPGRADEFGFPPPTHSPPPLDLLNTPSITTTDQGQPSSDTKEKQEFWGPRKNEVRDAFKHAWSNYKRIAYPNDELLSLSAGTSNKFVLLPYTFFPLNFLEKKV